jgi:hypothetical protein
VTTHCCCNSYHYPETKIWDHKSSPSSLDLAPSDYHVIGTLKKALRGRRFHSDNEVKETVNFFLLKCRSLSKDVKSALRRTVTKWKNNILFGSVYMMCIPI